MFSATRTINTTATLRASAAIRQGSLPAPFYDCEVTSAFVSSGWVEHMAKANQLLLAPATAGYDMRLMTLVSPKMIIAAESGNTLSADSLPPSTGIVTLSGADLAVTRLDASGTDSRVTLEFRTNFAALPSIAPAETTDFNRVYLLATSTLVEYQITPANGANGATEPGVLHRNVAGAGTFVPGRDLYILTSDGGSIVADGDGDNVWFRRPDILTNVLWSSEVVLCSCELRRTVVDEVAVDILRGSATSAADISMRLVI